MSVTTLDSPNGTGAPAQGGGMSPSPTRVWRILLAEDYAMVRRTLRLLIEEDPAFEIVAEAADGAMAVELARRFHPDVLVTDLMMPVMTGLELLREVRASSPETRGVVVSIHRDEPYVIEAFRHGASAYLLKDTLSTHLLPALRAAVAGERYVSPSIELPGTPPPEAATAGDDLDVWETLTSREQQVLRLASENDAEGAIARHLSIHPDAARLLLDNLGRKLGVQTRAELIELARARGFR